MSTPKQLQFVPIPRLRIEMSTTPVTQSQWLTVMGGKNPSANQGYSRDNHPVERVDAAQALAFCNRLRELDGGRVYRLPTTVEWTLAAEGGSDSVVWGDGHKIGWFNPLAAGETAAVGLLPPNGYGLHDMLGNVWEWARGDGAFRWICGGSWAETFDAAAGMEFKTLCRHSVRKANIGFRVVREAQ